MILFIDEVVLFDKYINMINIYYKFYNPKYENR